MAVVADRYDIIKSGYLEFGHQTQGKYALNRIALQKIGDPEPLGMTTPKEEIFVYSQFFAFYSRDFDGNNNDFGSKITSAAGVNVTQMADGVVKYNNEKINDGGMNMYFLGIRGISQEQYTHLRLKIEPSLSKYLLQQMLAMFIANYYDVNRYGFRVYFDEDSLDLDFEPHL